MQAAEQAFGTTRTSLELYFADIPEKLDTLGVEMGSNESIKQAVMAGLGLALISAHTVAQEVGRGWLSVLDVEGIMVLHHHGRARAKRGNASIARFLHK